MSNFYVAAHGLLINDNNEILILKRSKSTDYMPDKWDIPGGSVEFGEIVEDALIREFVEETKLNVFPIKPIHIYSNMGQLPHRQTIQIVYLCKFDKGEVLLNPEEHSEYKWIKYSDLNKYECIAFLESLSKNYTV